jgi:hypothetical protein
LAHLSRYPFGAHGISATYSQPACHDQPAPSALLRLAPKSHRLARRGKLEVAEVLDEVFIDYHPQVQRAWAGFHSLDDHRGGPPARTTGDRVRTPPQMLSVLTARGGLTALPSSDAAFILTVLRGLVVLPVRDARPAQRVLTWRRENANANIAELAGLAAGAAAEELPAVGAEEHVRRTRIVQSRDSAQSPRVGAGAELGEDGRGSSA